MIVTSESILLISSEINAITLSNPPQNAKTHNQINQKKINMNMGIHKKNTCDTISQQVTNACGCGFVHVVVHKRPTTKQHTSLTSTWHPNCGHSHIDTCALPHTHEHVVERTPPNSVVDHLSVSFGGTQQRPQLPGMVTQISATCRSSNSREIWNPQTHTHTHLCCNNHENKNIVARRHIHTLAQISHRRKVAAGEDTFFPVYGCISLRFGEQSEKRL